MNRHLTIRTILPAALLLLLPVMTLAADAKTPAADPKGVTYDQLATVSAKVEALDQASRMVTLRGPKGNAVTLQVGDEVRNLAQVKVGDMVVVRYYESIALQLEKGTGAPPVAAAAAGRAEPGQKPAAAGMATIAADVTVQSIDAKAMVVTVKGPQGNLFDVKARDPKRVAELKVGDVIRVTYTQALAVSVEPAAK
jgi:hypothetical protein